MTGPFRWVRLPGPVERWAYQGPKASRAGHRAVVQALGDSYQATVYCLATGRRVDRAVWFAFDDACDWSLFAVEQHERARAAVQDFTASRRALNQAS